MKYSLLNKGGYFFMSGHDKKPFYGILVWAYMLSLMEKIKEKVVNGK